MADPVSLMVLALAQALIAGAGKGIGEAAGRDAYYALRNALWAGYPHARSGLEDLESRPDSPEAQDQLIMILRSTEAGTDNNFQQLTARLQAAIKGISQKLLVDEQERTAGYNQFQRELALHLCQLIDIRNRYRVNDAGLLSANISRAADVPGDLRAEVRGLHNRMRGHIEKVARKIEGTSYADTEAFISRLPALGMRERAASLVRADRELHVSYQTLCLTISYFSRFNSMLENEISRGGSAAREIHLMFGQAIMICELADYVITFIEGFSPGGIRDLEDLHRAAQQRIDETRADLRRLVERANSGQIDPALRDSRLKSAQEREKALSVVQEEWESYIAEAGQFYSRVAGARGIIPNLEFIRDDARIQIAMLEEVAILQILRESVKSIQGAVDLLAGFTLAPLNETRVRRLLGETGPQ
jgi:hypothetical protein